MKKCLLLVLVAVLALSCLTGCRMATPVDTTPTTTPTTAPTDAPTEPSQPAGAATTESARILSNIWAAYGDEERFASYGGAVENSIADAPGDLDITNTEEITTRYLLPESHIGSVTEAASLVHLMNNNIFTAVVFKLANSADATAVAKALRDNVQSNQWICGQPDRLMIVNMNDGHLLMVFGSTDTVDTFRGKLAGVYAGATTVYDEGIVA